MKMTLVDASLRRTAGAAAGGAAMCCFARSLATRSSRAGSPTARSRCRDVRFFGSPPVNSHLSISPNSCSIWMSSSCKYSNASLCGDHGCCRCCWCGGGLSRLVSSTAGVGSSDAVGCRVRTRHKSSMNRWIVLHVTPPKESSRPQATSAKSTAACAET